MIDPLYVSFTQKHEYLIYQRLATYLLLYLNRLRIYTDYGFKCGMNNFLILYQHYTFVKTSATSYFYIGIISMVFLIVA